MLCWAVNLSVDAFSARVDKGKTTENTKIKATAILNMLYSFHYLSSFNLLNNKNTTTNEPIVINE